MKTTEIFKIWALGLVLMTGACKTAELNPGYTKTGKTSVVNESEQYIKAVRSKYAPDGRVALFDVKSTNNYGTYILKGESNLPEAVNALKQRLQA